MAALVALEAEELQGTFLDNAFTMTPWETWSVIFESPGSTPPSTERLLQDLKITSVEKAMRLAKRKTPA